MIDLLPKSWKDVSFMDVFDIQGGTQPPKKTFIYEPRKGYIRLLQIRDFGDKPLPTYIPVKSTLKTCNSGDILIGRYGASVGRICSGMEGAYNVALAKVIIPQGVDNKFVRFLLLSENFQRPILTLERSAQNGFNKDDLKDITIPIPPANEQKRIVTKLEKLLAKVNDAKERLGTIPRILKRFRQSVLAAACSGRLTADWRKRQGLTAEFEPTTVEAIADYVGGFAYKSKTFINSGKNQVIRIGNVRPLALNLAASPVFIPKDIADDTQRFVLEADDIVISMTGTKYKRDYGCAAIIQENGGSLFLNQRVGRLRCKGKVLPKFLLFWLQTNLFLDFFFSGETGNVNQGNVGADGIRKAPIELPEILEQKEIILRVEKLFNLAETIEARYAKANKFVDKLTQSILAKAFRGELVPQDPADEPAEKLLEKIKSDQGANKSKPQRKRDKKSYYD